MTERCVCCGEIIPEGQQTCPSCKSGKRLKACPFCGGECDIAFADNRVVNARELLYAPFCKNYECFMNLSVVSFYSEEEAIEAWNRRAEDGTA